MSVDALGRSAARGAMVSLVGQGLRVLVQVLGVMILARLLSPTDYGLLAMVTVIIGVGDILRDFGLSTAAVQARELSDDQRGVLWWLNTSIGAGLSLIVFAIAPLVAGLFNQPDLVGICRGLSVTFLLNGAATQYRASLERDLRFAAIASAEIGGAVAALGCAIAMADSDWGFWALVAQQVLTAGGIFVLLAAQARWLPGRPRRNVPLDGMLHFGWHMAVSQLIGYVSNNADSFVIALRYGSAPLGIYNRAFQLLMQTYNQVRVPVTKVAIPILSRLQEDDTRFYQFVMRGQIALGYTLTLGLGIVAGVGCPASTTLLGSGWEQVGPILSFLAIAAAVQTLALVNYWVYVTKGLTGSLMRYSWISAAIKVVCILTGSQYGILGVAIGYAVAPILSWPLSFWWLSRQVTLPLNRLLGGALRILLTSSLAGAASWGATRVTAMWPPALQCFVGVAAGVLVAALVAAVTPVVRQDWRAVAATVRMVRS